MFENVKSSMQQVLLVCFSMQATVQAFRKCYPITVRLYDVHFNRIMTHFFDMNLLEGRDSSTAEVMSTVLIRNYQNMRLVGTTVLLWASIILIQTSVWHNSIKSRAQAKNDCVIVTGSLFA